PMSLPMTASPALDARANASKTPSTPTIRYLCFGAFQLDTQREVLFKDGTKVRLPGKVFQTLVALLEKPGEVLTREALRERLWPEGQFVNYDANVNTTVNKLRLVLGDSPDRPCTSKRFPAWATALSEASSARANCRNRFRRRRLPSCGRPPSCRCPRPRPT